MLIKKRKIIVIFILLISIGLVIFSTWSVLFVPRTFIGGLFHIRYQKEQIINNFNDNQSDFENVINYINKYNAQFDSGEQYGNIQLYKNKLEYEILGVDKEYEINLNSNEKSSLLKIFNALHYNKVIDSPRFQNENNSILYNYNTIIFEIDDYYGDDVHGILYIYDGNKPVEWESNIYSYEHLKGNWYYWEGGWNKKRSIWNN